MISESSSIKPEPILIVIGTNRIGSLSGTVARYYKKVLEKRAIKTEILDLSHLPADFAGPTLYQFKGKNKLKRKMDPFVDKILAYQKIIFIIPEYNRLFPGVLKAFIDGISDKSWKNKKAALVGVAQGKGGGQLAVHAFSNVLLYLGMILLPVRPYLRSVPGTDEEALNSNPVFKKLIDQQAEEFISF